ncbi:glycosyltransferase family 2 protein [Paenibacillus amylolyticus]|uniref:glycosyltransferase family 2 protein n=1 Tax=Paenibacillus amylolyticus TaxID=1451 RepID=UPI001059C2C4|nr:glycosyltransferase family 2 protein [Paenibacillus amylolyticus]TDL65502.1 glycosyltransferase family 2 protein [Paenibacillus amylolyticus]
MNMGIGISLCMIVKDEAGSLQRCLNAVRDDVDEIIIVDTGSVDNTIEIARLHGAVVIRTEWNGDFSEARNLSLAAATKPWILVLDADEVWAQTPQMKTELMQLLATSRDDVWGYWIQVTSLLGVSGEERVTDAVCRLFRNDPRIAFQGRIHEEIASSIMALAPQGVLHSGLEVIHYGYLEQAITAKNKGARNMQLIRFALNQEGDQPELLYALAAEWFQQAKYDEALRLLQPLLAQLMPECGYHSDLVLKTAYAWRESGSPERALAVVEAWAPVYEDFPDLLELGAVLELDQGREDVALNWLKQAKSAASTASRYTSVSGAGTYRSLTLEGMAYERAGRWAEAEAAYIAALGLQPGSMAAWQRLLLLAAATGRPHAIASAAARVSLPPAAWQALIPAALAAHRPEWLLRHAAALAGPLLAQPLAAGLALAQLDEDAAARAALKPWAAHAQHGPEAALALWALGHKQPGGRNARAAARQQAALPAATHAAEALLQRGALARGSGRACSSGSPPRGATPGGPATPAPGGVLAAAQALAGVGAWAAWLRLLQALPPRGALALLAALPPAARCGLLRAPASVREGLLALCGTPDGAQQPHADEVPAPERIAHALLAGTLALLAGRQNLAREWAESAQLTARQPAATGRPAKTIPPGLHTLLRLTAPGAASAKEYTNQCNMLLVHL